MIHVHVYAVKEHLREFDMDTDDPVEAKQWALDYMRGRKILIADSIRHTKSDCHFIALVPESKP